MLQNSTIWKVMENKVLVTFTNFQEFLLIVSSVNFSTFKPWKKKKKTTRITLFSQHKYFDLCF